MVFFLTGESALSSVADSSHATKLPTAVKQRCMSTNQKPLTFCRDKPLLLLSCTNSLNPFSGHLCLSSATSAVDLLL